MSYRCRGEASQLSVIGCRIVGQARRLPIHGMASGSACPTKLVAAHTHSLLPSQLQQFGSDPCISLFPFAPFAAVTAAKQRPAFQSPMI